MVTFTATVTADGAAPAGDGSVEFVDSTTGTELGMVAVINGRATLPFTFATLTAGDTIVATYIPTSGALEPSSGQVQQAAVPITTTTLTGPTSTPVYSQTVILTATVTDTTQSDGTPTGSVEFFDGSTDLGPGTPLIGGGDSATSTFSTASLTPGAHAIRAVYTPTGAFQAGAGSLELSIAPIPVTPPTIVALRSTRSIRSTIKWAREPARRSPKSS